MHSIATQSIQANISKVQGRLAESASAADRPLDAICLIGISKTQDIAAVRAAADGGLTHFGENYLQEALPKIVATRGLGLTWHYVGAIQANKTRDLAENFDWIHTVERLKVARRLSDQCPSGKVLNVCLQVNIDGDPNKSGVTPDAVDGLLQAASDLPNLQIRGLMTILDPQSDPAASYTRLQSLFANVRRPAPAVWDVLSMGMSSDYPAAIAAGATHVRVGTAIFGPRKPRKQTSSQPEG